MERNEEKIKNKKTSLLWNQHKIWGELLALGVIAWLIGACGASISTVVGIYLGYRVLRLVLKLIRQIFSVLFTVVSILIMIIIISLLIF